MRTGGTRARHVRSCGAKRTMYTAVMAASMISAGLDHGSPATRGAQLLSSGSVAPSAALHTHLRIA